MKQKLSSPCFTDVIFVQRKVKQAFFTQIDKLIDCPLSGVS